MKSLIRRSMFAIVALGVMGFTGTFSKEAKADRASEMSMLSLMVSIAPFQAAQFMSVGTAELAVASVEASGEVSVLMLEDAGKSLKVSFAIPQELAEELQIVVGDKIIAKSTDIGHILHKAEKAIAIVPNQLGKQLILDAKS